METLLYHDNKMKIVEKVLLAEWLVHTSFTVSPLRPGFLIHAQNYNLYNFASA